MIRNMRIWWCRLSLGLAFVVVIQGGPVKIALVGDSTVATEGAGGRVLQGHDTACDVHLPGLEWPQQWDVKRRDR
jgi:hypothetical protein